MKKLITLLFCVLTTTLLLAQDSDLIKQSRWSFGAQIEAGYSGESDLQENYYPNPQFGDYASASELKRQPGYSTGLWSEYQLGYRWALHLSVNYSHFRAFSRNASTSYNTSGGMASYYESRNRTYQHQLRIPLEGQFYFGKPNDRARFFIKAGVQASYLLAQTNVTEEISGGLGQETYEGGYGEQLDLTAEWLRINRWQSGILAGIGLTMDRVTLSLQRSWNVNLGDKNRNPYNSYPYICGFGNAYCDLPAYYNNGPAIQFQQTNFRFAYRLF